MRHSKINAMSLVVMVASLLRLVDMPDDALRLLIAVHQGGVVWRHQATFGRLVCPSPNTWSVVPVSRDLAKDITVQRHPTERERHMRAHQRVAACRQFPQKTDPHAGRLLRVVFKAIVPVRMVKPDREDGVADERHMLAAG